ADPSYGAATTSISPAGRRCRTKGSPSRMPRCGPPTAGCSLSLVRLASRVPEHPGEDQGGTDMTETATPETSSTDSRFDVAQIDEVLATTRAVRRRLDLERPVDNQLLLDCIDLAEQAPTGGNLGSRRWIIVREQRVKDQLGELYRETALPFMSAAAERLHGTGHPSEKVMASAAYLAEHLAEVPAIVIPTVIGR